MIYQVGDPDPTPSNSKRGYCSATSGGDGCTWERFHTHPQHIAGTGEIVAHVWSVR